jgi:hypothetical protein
MSAPQAAPTADGPNLFIAGVAKAGTTSLFRYLGQHPDICPSTVKEPRYFTALRHGEPLGPWDEYAALFGHCGGARYRLEATPGYFPGGQVVAGAIDQRVPGARVIVSLRNPVQRCWSWYRFVRRSARIPKELTFPAYLDRCFQLHEDGVDHLRENQPFWGVGGGCYDEWIDAWLETFGARLRIEYFEELVAGPEAVTTELCRWLAVDPAPAAGFDYQVENRTVQYKHRRLQRLALAVNRRSERFFGRRPALKRILRGAYYGVNGERGRLRLDPASEDRLTAFYAPHTERLAASLAAAGRTRMPGWLTVPAAVGGNP